MLCQALITNEKTQKQLHEVIQAMQQGVILSKALAKFLWVSPQLMTILALGENSGTLPSLLLNFTQAQQEQWQAHMQNMKVWLEPIFLCVIGGLIGVVLIALYLPMIELGQHV